MPGRDANEGPTMDDRGASHPDGASGRTRAVDGLLLELARAGDGDDERFVEHVMSLVRADRTLEITNKERTLPVSPPGALPGPERPTYRPGGEPVRAGRGTGAKRRSWRAVAGIATAAAAAAVAFVALRYPAPRAEGAYRIAGEGRLRRGATLTTHERPATLELGGYCLIEIEPRTTLRIEGERKAEQVHLARGKIACDVDRSGGSFTVATDVEESRIEVGGTKFSVEVAEARGANEMLRKRLSVKVLVGSVLVAGTWGRARAIAGEAVDVPRPGAGAVAETAGGEINPPLAAKVLPARTLSLFVVDNVTKTAETFKETSIYKLWKEKEVQAFIEPIRPKVQAILTKAEETGQLKFADIAAAFGGQIGLAFVGLELQEGERRGGGEPLPEMALVAEITDYAAASRLLGRARREIEKTEEARLKTWDVGPLSFGRITGEGDRMELGYILTQSALYMALGPDGKLLTEMLAAATVGGGETLATDKEFLAAVERAGPRRDLFAYQNVRGMVDAAFEVAARRTPPEELTVARRVLEVLGLDTVRSVFFAEAVDPPGFRSRLFVHAPSPRKGLFELVSEEPVRDSMLRLAPADARSLGAVRLRIDRALPLLRKILRVTEPRAIENLDRTLAQVKEMYGFDVERSFLEGLGLEGEIIAAPVAVAGMAPMADFAGISLVMRIAKPEDFAPAYGILMLMAQGISAQRKITVSDSEAPGGATVKSFAIPMLNPWGIVPSIAMTEKHLVISLSAEAAKAVCAAIETPPAEPLVASADYMKALARVGVAPGFLVSYGRPMREKDLKTILGMAQFAAFPLASAAAGPGMPPELSDLIRSIDLTKLPPPSTLAKHGLSQIAVGWTNEDGVGVTTYGPVGISAGAAAVGGAGLVVAIPNIMRARERAAMTRCSAGMRQVWKGLSDYARDHGGKFPPTLGDLVPNYVATPQALRCPASGRAYTYVSGLISGDQAHLIVAYESPGNHRRGANVVYAGGTVRWRPNAQFIQRQVDAYVRRLKAQGRTVKVIGPQSAPAAPNEPEEFF